MQNIVIAGRVVKEDAKEIGSGSARFSLAVVGREKREGKYEPVTVFYDVIVGGKLAEFATTHARKGKAFVVAGTLKATAYVAKDGTAKPSLSVFASTVSFAPDSKEDEAPTRKAPAKGKPALDDEPF